MAVLEIVGKYCPGCKAIRHKVEAVAEQATIPVYTICTDTDYVPELSRSKPYTPIFWLYKKGEPP